MENMKTMTYAITKGQFALSCISLLVYCCPAAVLSFPQWSLLVFPLPCFDRLFPSSMAAGEILSVTLSVDFWPFVCHIDFTHYCFFPNQVRPKPPASNNIVPIAPAPAPTSGPPPPMVAAPTQMLQRPIMLATKLSPTSLSQVILSLIGEKVLFLTDHAILLNLLLCVVYYNLLVKCSKTISMVKPHYDELKLLCIFLSVLWFASSCSLLLGAVCVVLIPSYKWIFPWVTKKMNLT